MILWPDESRLDEEWNHLLNALHSDMHRFEELININDCDCWRRSYCRSIFSLIDAVTSQLNRAAIYWNYPTLLGDKEVKELEGRCGILSNVYSAFDFYSNTSGADTPLVKGSKEWFVLQEAVKIRNRVTHPKLSEDIEISDDDLCRLKSAKEVFISLVTACMMNSGNSLIEKAEALHKAATSFPGSMQCQMDMATGPGCR